jgi:uncharacterized RDD family membrane protein YckC
VARRLSAQLLDVVAFWTIFWVVMAISTLLMAGGAAVGGGSEEAAVAAGLGWIAAIFWSYVGYVVFALWFLAQGKTPGQWLVKIQVVDKRNGNNPGLGRMLVRELFGKFISGLFFGLGYFWAIFDPDGQAWHDKIAGTVVVHKTAVLVPVAQSAASSWAASAAVGGETHALKAPATTRPALSTAEANPIKTGDPTVSVFCGQCGGKLKQGDVFCDHCGAKQSNSRA